MPSSLDEDEHTRREGWSRMVPWLIVVPLLAFVVLGPGGARDGASFGDPTPYEGRDPGSAAASPPGPRSTDGRRPPGPAPIDPHPQSDPAAATVGPTAPMPVPRWVAPDGPVVADDNPPQADIVARPHNPMGLALSTAMDADVALRADGPGVRARASLWIAVPTDGVGLDLTAVDEPLGSGRVGREAGRVEVERSRLVA